MSDRTVYPAAAQSRNTDPILYHQRCVRRRAAARRERNSLLRLLSLGLSLLLWTVLLVLFPGQGKER